MTTQQATEILTPSFEKLYRKNLNWFVENIHWDPRETIQKYVNSITKVELLIDPVHPEEPITISGYDKDVGGMYCYDYVGPGHLALFFYIDDYNPEIESFFNELYESHMTQDWLQETFLRYFGLDLFLDFADVILAVKKSDTDEYILEIIIDGNETNAHVIKERGSNSWKLIENC
ncbi:hypothetical protein EB155_09300 [archaeon]|nr:hypothetical protein [archaeon]